jgi:hypothetical protein
MERRTRRILGRVRPETKEKREAFARTTTPTKRCMNGRRARIKSEEEKEKGGGLPVYVLCK